jgi:hypothetical protein
MMSDFPKSQVRQTVLVRAMNTMVRALGGGPVRLRVPSAAAAGLERELGITAPALEELEIGPVVVRKLAEKAGRARVEVIVSASSLAPLLSGRGDASAYLLLKSAESLMYDERVFRVTAVSAESFGGVEYMYRVTAVE